MTYSGSTGWPEWLIINSPTTETYHIEVVGVNTASGGSFELSELDLKPIAAMLDAAKQIGWSFARTYPVRNQIEAYSFSIYETGGTTSVQNLIFTPTDFKDIKGIILPSNQITCAGGSSILAGGQETVSCQFNVKKAQTGGIYSGKITISGQTPNGTAVSTDASVNITLYTDPPPFVNFFPTIKK